MMVFEVPLNPDALETGVSNLTGACSVIIRDCEGQAWDRAWGMRPPGRLAAYWNFVSLPSCVCAEENESEKKLGEFRGRGEGTGQKGEQNFL